MIIMVTGATAGFGESITRRFIANGHKVIATGRREERLKTLKDELGDNLYIAQRCAGSRPSARPALFTSTSIACHSAGRSAISVSMAARLRTSSCGAMV